MSDTLENLISKAVKSGRLNHVSLAFLNDGVWSASYRGVDGDDKRIVEHPDPVEALTCALSGRKPSAAPPPAKRQTRTKAAPAAVAPPPDDNDLEDLLV